MQIHLSDFSLKGSIKSFSEKSEEFSLTTCNPYSNINYFFDQNGYLIKKITGDYGLGYARSITFLYEYDKLYNLVKEIELITENNSWFNDNYNKKIIVFKNGKRSMITVYNEDIIQLEKSFKYDKNGLKKEVNEKYLQSYKCPSTIDDFFREMDQNSNSNPTKEEYVFESTIYDAERNIILETIKDHQNNLKSKITYSYDKNRNRIKKTIYKNEKEISKKFLFKYDNFKNCIEIKEYNEKGVLLINEKRTYNAKRQIKETLQHSYDGFKTSTQKYTYIYNQENMLTETIHITVDHKGNIKEERDIERDIQKRTKILKRIARKKITEYDYDKVGNWIRKTVKSKDLDEQTIYTRNIKYY